MKFSMILATLNRSFEINLCLESLLNQSYKDYEIIIVDQSEDNETQKVVKRLNSEIIKYIHINKKGLSNARNCALKYVSGDYFCLIDDDAYYPENYLEILRNNIIHYGEKCIYSGYIWNTLTNKALEDYPSHNIIDLSYRKILRYCPSAAITFPMTTIKEIGFFDDNFGVGAKFGSCEETDYLIRCHRAGYQINYIRELEILHPHKELVKLQGDNPNPQKIYNYAYGFGGLVAKHFRNDGISYLDLYYLESLLKDVAKFILKKNCSEYELSGHIKGYQAYKNK